MNISGVSLNPTSTEFSELELSGNILYNGSILWRGVGQYFHGSGVTGYSYNLAEAQFQKVEPLDKEGTSVNITLDRDAYRLGMKPYEEVQIIFTIDLFYELESDGDPIFSPLVEKKSRTLLLVDEDKVEYLEDKLGEIESEVNIVVYAEGLDDFNRTKYLDYVASMNHSLTIGDYSEALDQWEKWDKKERINMFSSFTNKVRDQTVELESLLGYKEEYEALQIEYNHLNDKYVAIFKEKTQNLAELEATKQGLSTAITGVFLSAIVFFFLGRRTAGDNV